MNESDTGMEDAPRAMVRGEEFRNWPVDLYIPPDALEVFLESFQGPLDLLLYLIRRQNLDILDIPIAEITRQYVEYIDVMRLVKLDLAAEYLVMAAWLAEIKSRLLLPRPQTEDEPGEDPRAALVRRLQEYERFRQAAFDIDDRPRLERDLYVACIDYQLSDEARPKPQVDLQELVRAFSRVLANAEHLRHLAVSRETLSVRERMTSILSRLRDAEFVRFEEMFTPGEGRMGVVVTFIAILELVKEEVVVIVQNEPFAPIHIQVAA